MPSINNKGLLVIAHSVRKIQKTEPPKQTGDLLLVEDMCDRRRWIFVQKQTKQTKKKTFIPSYLLCTWMKRWVTITNHGQMWNGTTFEIYIYDMHFIYLDLLQAYWRIPFFHSERTAWTQYIQRCYVLHKSIAKPSSRNTVNINERCRFFDCITSVQILATRESARPVECVHFKSVSYIWCWEAILVEKTKRQMALQWISLQGVLWKPGSP